MTEPRNPLEVVEEALETITKAEGPYGRDRLTHAENTITHMVMQARAALALVRKMRADAVVGWAAPGSAGEWAFGREGDGRRGGWRPALLMTLPLPDSTEDDDD